MKRTLLLLTSLFLLLGITPGLPWLDLPSATAKSAFKIPKPPNRGTPGTASAGASRTDVALTALVPIEPTATGGYTTLEQPTVWFYNPYGAAPADPLKQSQLVGLKLTLKDDQAKVVDSIMVPLPAKAGLLSVRFAKTMKLQPDRPYRWSLQARVQQPSSEVPEIIVVDGWIQREMPTATLVQALKTATLKEQFQIYRQNGIWFDALTSLAELRSQCRLDPALEKEWVNLLSSANLPKPVINCSLGTCKP